MKRSLKYSMLLGLCKLVRLQRVMELPPEKAQKLFLKAYKGVVIPKMYDERIGIKKRMCLAPLAFGTCIKRRMTEYVFIWLAAEC